MQVEQPVQIQTPNELERLIDLYGLRDTSAEPTLRAQFAASQAAAAAATEPVQIVVLSDVVNQYLAIVDSSDHYKERKAKEFLEKQQMVVLHEIAALAKVDISDDRVKMIANINRAMFRHIEPATRIEWRSQSLGLKTEDYASLIDIASKLQAEMERGHLLTDRMEQMLESMRSSSESAEEFSKVFLQKLSETESYSNKDPAAFATLYNNLKLRLADFIQEYKNRNAEPAQIKILENLQSFTDVRPEVFAAKPIEQRQTELQKALQIAEPEFAAVASFQKETHVHASLAYAFGPAAIAIIMMIMQHLFSGNTVGLNSIITIIASLALSSVIAALGKIMYNFMPENRSNENAGWSQALGMILPWILAATFGFLFQSFAQEAVSTMAHETVAAITGTAVSMLTQYSLNKLGMYGLQLIRTGVTNKLAESNLISESTRNTLRGWGPTADGILMVIGLMGVTGAVNYLKLTAPQMGLSERTELANALTQNLPEQATFDTSTVFTNGQTFQSMIQQQQPTIAEILTNTPAVSRPMTAVAPQLAWQQATTVQPITALSSKLTWQQSLVSQPITEVSSTLKWDQPLPSSEVSEAVKKAIENGSWSILKALSIPYVDIPLSLLGGGGEITLSEMASLAQSIGVPVPNIVNYLPIPALSADPIVRTYVQDMINQPDVVLQHVLNAMSMAR